MCILIIGKSGQVAQSLAATQPSWVKDVIYWSRDTLDLCDPSLIRPAVENSGARIIINAAAYTNVDKAEDEEELATLINGKSVGEMAKAAKTLNAPFIHISTDYVFDGTSIGPYVETAIPSPLGAYGRSKFMGEVAAQENYSEGVVILRTAWVFSPYGHNFLKTMLRLSHKHAHVSVVGDQIGNPTSALMIARGIWHILDIWRASPGKGLGNIYHLTGANSATWYSFACSIFQNLAAYGGPKVAVSNIPSAAYQTTAKRPVNSQLETSLFTRTFNFTPPNWQISLSEVMKKLRNSSSG